MHAGNHVEPPRRDPERQRRRVDEVPAAIDEIVPQELRAHDIRSRHTERLAARVHRGQDATAQPESINQSGPRRTETTGGMGLIDKQSGAMLLRQGRHLRQRRAVALHAGSISAIIAAAPGQYAPGSRAVVFMGKKRQAVKESVVQVADRLKVQGIAL